MSEVAPTGTAADSLTPPRMGIIWGIRLLGLAAAAGAGYLFKVSLDHKGAPLGCGSGSGCDEVLHSRWATAFGIPVSGVAAVAYLAIVQTTQALSPGRSWAAQRRGWTALLALAAAVGVSAVWFVGLQAFVLRAFCPWCLGDHALGLALAGLIITCAPRRLVFDDADAVRTTTIARGRPLAVGSGMAGVLIISQILISSPGAAVGRLPEGENADTGPGPERRLAVLNGRLPLAVHEVPSLGSPDAPKQLVLLFDYRCPHCRATHGYLQEGMQRYSGQFGVLLLPTPLNADCNPAVEETEERFTESCDLARLALAVWRTDRDAFREFDAWLFEPESPPTLAEARAYVAMRISEADLARALADPWIDERLRANVEAYAAGGVQQIPVLLSPGFAAVIGRPASREQLFEILEQDLGLVPQ